jgi:hypothetical protein
MSLDSTAEPIKPKEHGLAETPQNAPIFANYGSAGSRCKWPGFDERRPPW